MKSYQFLVTVKVSDIVRISSEDIVKIIKRRVVDGDINSIKVRPLEVMPLESG